MFDPRERRPQTPCRLCVRQNEPVPRPATAARRPAAPTSSPRDRVSFAYALGSFGVNYVLPAVTGAVGARGAGAAGRGGPLGGRGTTVVPGGTGRAIAGHGRLEAGAGSISVPKGTTLSVWTMDGTSLPDSVGTLIEQGNYSGIAADPALAAQVEGAHSLLPGATLPNYTISPPSGLTITQRSLVVRQPTPLGQIVRPNMGHIDCAFCLE
jgi:hypothetical protein